MNKICFLLLFIFALQYNQAQILSAKNDKLGLEVYTSTFVFENIYLTDELGVRISNKIKYRKELQIQLHVSNLDHAVFVDDYARLDGDIALFNDKQHVLLEAEDILEDKAFSKFENEGKIDLMSYLTIGGQKMDFNKLYTLYTRFYDKNGKGYIIILYKFKFVK